MASTSSHSCETMECCGTCWGLWEMFNYITNLTHRVPCYTGCLTNCIITKQKQIIIKYYFILVELNLTEIRKRKREKRMEFIILWNYSLHDNYHNGLHSNWNTTNKYFITFVSLS